VSDRIMKSYRFRAEREADWLRLDAIIKRAENRGVAGLSDADMAALPGLYRLAVSSLSVARSLAGPECHRLSGDTLRARLFLRLRHKVAVLGAHCRIFRA